MDQSISRKMPCSPKSFIPWFEIGKRKVEALGIELELFIVDRAKGLPLPYSGTPGVKNILEALEHEGWERIGSKELPAGMKSADGTLVTLEPGCALEVSTPPLESIVANLKVLSETLKIIISIAEPLGCVLVPQGAAPFGTNEMLDWLPKSRVTAQRDYFVSQAEGHSGIQVMSGICSLQLNFDFLNHQDLLDKYRVLHLIAPTMAALSANGSFSQGELLPLASRRQLVWLDADALRTGMPPTLFEDKAFSIENYIQWVLNMPLMFLKREEQFQSIPKKSFSQWCTENFPDQSNINISDWKIHNSSIFPDVRLRQYLELRTMDTPPIDLLPALAGLVSLVLYSSKAREKILESFPRYTVSERTELYSSIARHGILANFHSTELTVYAKELLELAQESLEERIQKQVEPHKSTDLLEPLKTLLSAPELNSARSAPAHVKTGIISPQDFMQNYALTAEEIYW